MRPYHTAVLAQFGGCCPSCICVRPSPGSLVMFLEFGKLRVPSEAEKKQRFHYNHQQECLSQSPVHILTKVACKSQGPSARQTDKLPATSL